MSIMTSYNLINGVPTADSYDLNTDIARGEWGFEGLIMTDWNGGSSSPDKSMHAGNDLIMPGGASRVTTIIKGACDYAPIFDEKGQIGLDTEMMMMFSYQVAAWRDFAVCSQGQDTVDAVLGDGYTASVDASGNILVNGENIYREYESNMWAGTGTYKTPVTTEVASVSADGKTITYKGDYADNNIISLGDVQRCAMNNLNIIMRSNDMARIYGTEAVSYTDEFDNLVSWIQVDRSEVTVGDINASVVKGLKEMIAMIDGLDASEYTKESWAALETATEAAKAVVADENATQADYSEAMGNLVAAFGGLEYGVQKLHLSTAIEAAEAILQLSGDYESVDALEAAVEAGKAVLANGDATQEEVNAAANAILDQLFELAEVADVSSLRSLVNAAKNLFNGKYTSESLENLENAITGAEAVLADPDREDGAISDAYASLVQAIMNLEMKGNKAALQSMLEKANEILEHADAYVSYTIAGLADAVADAQAVYDNDDAVQSEVNAAVEALTLKVAEARLLGDVDGDGTVTTGDSAKLLQANAEISSLSAEEAASADVNGDGTADTSDAVLILQYAAEKIAAF